MKQTSGQLGKTLPKLDLRAPSDPTRVSVSPVTPPDNSIYGTPLSNTPQLTHVTPVMRGPSTSQVGSNPNTLFPEKP